MYKYIKKLILLYKIEKLRQVPCDCGHCNCYNCTYCSGPEGDCSSIQSGYEMEYLQYQINNL